MNYCEICGTPYGVEDHHIIFKSIVKPLDKCPKNHVYLCNIHHRDHRNGVHFNSELDQELKSEFRQWLEESFCNEDYSMEEIQKILGIGANSTKRLCKAMHGRYFIYPREEIIRVCMGG